MDGVHLRMAAPADIPVFFVQQLDPDANWMAAFGPANPLDRAAFEARWVRNLASDANTSRTIVDSEGRIAGYISSFPMEGDLDVGYWIGREFWGRGIATEALRQFVELVPDRPLSARAAKDNAASIRVLEKCGFRIVGEETSYAEGRGTDIVEALMQLE